MQLQLDFCYLMFFLLVEISLLELYQKITRIIYIIHIIIISFIIIIVLLFCQLYYKSKLALLFMPHFFRCYINICFHI